MLTENGQDGVGASRQSGNVLDRQSDGRRTTTHPRKSMTRRISQPTRYPKGARGKTKRGEGRKDEPSARICETLLSESHAVNNYY